MKNETTAMHGILLGVASGAMLWLAMFYALAKLI